MVLKIRPKAKSFLPLVPDLTRVLTGFDRFLAFLSNQTGARFPVEPVESVGLVRFLNHGFKP